MFKTSVQTFVFLLTILIIQLFANRNLFSQENSSQSTTWQTVLEQLNNLDDIHENAKITHLSNIENLVKSLAKGPTKDQITKVNSNRAKLTLAKICIDAKKYFWVEEIYLQIDIRKLSNSENKTLFEIAVKSLLLFPDREISKTLMEILKSLTKICRKELIENPGELQNLYEFYVQKQLFIEAMDLAEILWKDDEFLFHCGTLHSRAYRLRWNSNNDVHLKLAMENFEAIENNFPNSLYILPTQVNLFLLDAENKTSIKQIEIFNLKIKDNIEKITLESMRDILEVFSDSSKKPEIIKLLIECYQTLIIKNGNLLIKELILSFLSDKSGLSLTELVKIIKTNYNGEKTLPDNFKNASILKKIQYLANWNSVWEPQADFYDPATSFRFDPITQTSYIITKNSNKSQISFTYFTSVQDKLPDYIFFDIKNLGEQNIYAISFNYDGKENLIDKIVCTSNKSLIRIVVTPEMKKSKKWQINIKNESKLKSSIIEISAPVFLTIQNIEDLDKKTKE